MSFARFISFSCLHWPPKYLRSLQTSSLVCENQKIQSQNFVGEIELCADDSSCPEFDKDKLSLTHRATAIAVSFAICKAGIFVSQKLAVQGGEHPAATTIVVVLATLLPSYFRHLAPSGDAFALVLMHVSIKYQYILAL